jgi:hypothetical protein
MVLWVLWVGVTRCVVSWGIKQNGIVIEMDWVVCFESALLCEAVGGGGGWLSLGGLAQAA